MPDPFAELRHNLLTRPPTSAVESRSPGLRAVRRRPAAVLILLSDADRPDIVVTERSAHLNHHAGQVSFPGGQIDPTDAGPVEAALRETREEIGLAPSAVQVLGTLPVSHVAASGFDVVSVVGTWSGHEPVWAIDPAEVAAVYRFPVDGLADPLTRRSARLPGGYVGPAFVFPDPNDPATEVVIWGFTAHIIDRLLPLGGWERAWDRDRTIEIPRRFLRTPRVPGTGDSRANPTLAS